MNISVEIERLVKLIDVAIARLNERSELLCRRAEGRVRKKEQAVEE